MIELQTFLHEHGLQALCERFAIKAKRHPDYDNLVQLHYDQFDSPVREKIVQQCRAIILDEDDNWNIVARGYDRFFEFNEAAVASLDWKTARVQEKLDGSLILMYWYDNQWQIASKGLPDAAGKRWANGKTLGEMFWETWENAGYLTPSDIDEGFRDLTFLFEFMSPDTRVVVKHDKAHLVLHGVRDIETGEERTPAMIARFCGYPCVRSYPFDSMDAVWSDCKNLDPLEHEGFVVVDADFNRVKVKSEHYKLLAQYVNGIGNARLLELVRSDEAPEFLNQLDHLHPVRRDYEEMQARFDALCQEAETAYEGIKHIESVHEFSARAKETGRVSSAVFGLRNGYATAADFYRNPRVQTATLLRLLGLKDTAPVSL